MLSDRPASDDSLARWPSIDVLRGLAVSFVVLHHVHLRFKLRGFPVNDLVPIPVMRVLFWSGQLAVLLFFVISGFLITQRTLARWGRLERVQIGAFYRMRAARILPCLLALLAVLSLLHVVGASDYVIPPERASLGRALLAALGFHINWLEGTRGYLPGSWDVLWSLSVEETFYLAFPLVCIVARSERLVVLVLLALLVIGPITRVRIEGQTPWEDYAYLATADGLAYGCLAALARARLVFSPLVSRLMLVCGVCFVIAVWCFRMQLSELGLYDLGLPSSILQLGAALVLLGLTNPRSTPSRLRFVSPLMAAIGRVSYEVYLTHMFVVFAAAGIAQRLAAPAPVIMACYPLIMGVCVALGWVIARVYSEPANRRLRAESRAPLPAAQRAT